MFLSVLTEIRALPILPANSLQVDQLTVGSTPPPGTGAFKFVEYVPNNRTVVQRNEGYWGGAPYLERVIFRLIPDETVRFTALRAGDVHIAERLPFEWVPRIQRGEVAGIQLFNVPNTGVRRLAFNQTSPILRSKTLRQALAYALDRDAILAESFAGLGTPVNVQMPPGSIWEKVAPAPRQRDLAKARQLAQQAGYRGEQIVLMSRRGHENFAESVHRHLTEAGFNIKVEIVESAINEQREQEGRFDLATSGGSLEYDPVMSMKANVTCEKGPIRADNETGYCNPEVDSLFAAMETERDQQKRLDLFKRFAEIFWDDVVSIYIGTEPRYFGVSSNVQGFTPSNAGGYMHSDGGLIRTWLKS